MRTDSADVRPNARLISIKCRIRAVSARVARGERSRARRGARNLWKFCKWPKSVGRSAGAASAAHHHGVLEGLSAPDRPDPTELAATQTAAWPWGSAQEWPLV